MRLAEGRWEVTACGAERYPICMTYSSTPPQSPSFSNTYIFHTCELGAFVDFYSDADLPPQPAPPPPNCAPGDVRLGSLCYYLSKQPANSWDAARQECARRSARHELVSIHNTFEQNYLLAMLQLIFDPQANASVWIGLHNLKVCPVFGTLL